MTTPPAGRNLAPLAYALTRIGQLVTGRPAPTADIIFAPGQPLAPVTQEPRPRQMQYPVGVNLLWQPRRDWPDLTPFDTLRYLAKKHPLAALCIRVRAQQMLGIRGAYVATVKRAQAAEHGTCDALNQLIAQPDGETPFASWISLLVHEVLEIDAPCLYRRPARGGGIAGYELIDGATIKPLLNDWGRVAGYQQVLYGMALTQYRDSRGPEEVVGEYNAGELWYQPFNTSVTDPYGRAPMEDLITLAQTYIRKMGYDLAHFTDGNVPAALGVFDGQTLNVDQVMDFERDFNAVLAGDPARQSRIKFVPFPMKIERMQELSTGGQYEGAWEAQQVKLTCAFYGVTPAEIGFTADVNRATSDGQEDVTYRVGIRPLARWLKITLLDPIAQIDCGQRQIEWQWDVGETSDRKAQAETDKLYFDTGAVSGQELRALRYPDLDGPVPIQRAPAGGAEMDESSVPPILGYHIEAGVVSKNEARAQLLLPPEDETHDQRLRRFQSQLAVMTAAVAVGYAPDEAARLTGAPVPGRTLAPPAGGADAADPFARSY